MIQSTVPIGTIVPYAGPGPGDSSWEDNSGWLLCDGRSLNRTANGGKYAELFNAIGSSWGGDGVDNFNLPDLRGRFLRGVNHSVGSDPDAAARAAGAPGGHSGDQVGSFQGDELSSHTHPFSLTPNPHSHTYHVPASSGSSAKQEQGGLVDAQTSETTLQLTIQNVGGAETRPRNSYVEYIVNFKRGS